ncbi:MAG: 30S ribosomal protein S18 [Bryobacterales bacterium]
MAEDTKPDAQGGDRRDTRSDRGGSDRGGPDRGPRSGGGGGRGSGGSGGGGGGGRRFFRRKKVDYFSVNRVDIIDYKDSDTLRNFVGDRGKILPRRHTGLSAEHQRRLKRAIKRARNIALLPFAAGG